MSDKKLWDPICGREPRDIGDVVWFAKGEGMLPDDYVRAEEGTLDHESGFFTCTECYLKIGGPVMSDRTRWVASPRNLDAMGITYQLPSWMAVPSRLGLPADRGPEE